MRKEFEGIHFWDIQTFNLTLLGKQAWKLITCPDALISKLFKARYFPYNDFFDAQFRSSPSYT